MVRFFGPLTLLIFAAAVTQGQVTPPTPSASSTSTAPGNSARFESLRRLFEQLPPDQQQRVIQNLHAGQSPTISPSTGTPSSTGNTAATARFEAFRKSFEQLPADQQQRFMQNLRRWQNLSPEERDLLRQRERVRRQKQENSIDEAYQKSGLQLTEEQRPPIPKTLSPGTSTPRRTASPRNTEKTADRQHCNHRATQKRVLDHQRERALGGCTRRID